MNLLHLSHIKRTYNANSTHPVHALKDISFDVNAGEYIAIMGESGWKKYLVEYHRNLRKG